MAEVNDPLDVVVIRGHRTPTAIGVAAKFAKAKTTTLVLWDRRHKRSKGDSPNVIAALEKKVYQTMEEERPDAAVMSRAFESIDSKAPKCALLHVGSDKLVTSKDMERPLYKPQAIMRGVKENHLETLQAFYASGVYQPWVHSFKACVFHLIPPELDGDDADDVCLASMATRRFVKHDSLRLPDGSGWTFGLQLTDNDTALNSGLVFSYMVGTVLASENVKSECSGKIIRLLPTDIQ